MRKNVSCISSKASKKADSYQFELTRRHADLLMNEQKFEATLDPKEIAGRFGLEIVQWFEGRLYDRDKSDLSSIGPVDPQSNGNIPADLRICVRKARASHNGYVGEEYHSPREGAVRARLTIIEENQTRAELSLLAKETADLPLTGTAHGKKTIKQFSLRCKMEIPNSSHIP